MDFLDIGIASNYTDKRVNELEMSSGGGLTDEQLALLSSIKNKVDKDGNKVLSDVNFGSADKTKLDGLENFSKNYNDLINKPTIPSIKGLATEAYVVNQIGLISLPDLTQYEKIADNDTKLLGKAEKNHTHTNYVEKVTGKSLVDDTKITKLNELINTTIPTKTSQLTNDSNFVSQTEIADFQNSTQVTDIVNSLISEMKTEIASLKERITALEPEV